jgi:hypothetical protein
MASFCRWETNPFQISDQLFFERLTEYVNGNGSKVIVVIHNGENYNDNYENDIFRLQKVAVFEPAIVKNEEYTVFKVVMQNEH